MWTTSSGEVEANDQRREAALALADAEQHWPFLAAARTEAEYQNRKGMLSASAGWLGSVHEEFDGRFAEQQRTAAADVLAKASEEGSSKTAFEHDVRRDLAEEARAERASGETYDIMADHSKEIDERRRKQHADYEAWHAANPKWQPVRNPDGTPNKKYKAPKTTPVQTTLTSLHGSLDDVDLDEILRAEATLDLTDGDLDKAASFFEHKPKIDTDYKHMIDRGDTLEERHRQDHAERADTERRHDQYWSEHPEEHQRFLRNNASVQADVNGELLECPYCDGPLKGDYDNVECTKCSKAYDPKSLVADLSFSDGPATGKVLRIDNNGLARLVPYGHHSAAWAGDGSDGMPYVCPDCGKWRNAENCPHCDAQRMLEDLDRPRRGPTFIDWLAHGLFPSGAAVASRRITAEDFGSDRYTKDLDDDQVDLAAGELQGETKSEAEQVDAETKENLNSAKSAYPGDFPGGDKVTSVPKQAAVGDNLFGDAMPNEFQPQVRQPQTTRPRVTPEPVRDTSFTVPNAGDSIDVNAPVNQIDTAPVDYSKPSPEQMFAARTAKVAQRISEDNPHLSDEAVRDLARRAVSAYPEMVRSAGESRGAAGTCPVCYRENLSLSKGRLVTHNDTTREGHPRCEGSGREA